MDKPNWLIQPCGCVLYAYVPAVIMKACECCGSSPKCSACGQEGPTFVVSQSSAHFIFSHTPWPPTSSPCAASQSPFQHPQGPWPIQHHDTRPHFFIHFLSRTPWPPPRPVQQASPPFSIPKVPGQFNIMILDRGPGEMSAADCSKQSRSR